MAEDKKTTTAADTADKKAPAKKPAGKKPASKAATKDAAKKPAAKKPAAKTAAVPKAIAKAAQQSKGAQRKLRVTDRYEGTYVQGVGKRKTSTAVVRMYPGNGEIYVNNKAVKEYFPTAIETQKITAPLKLAGVQSEYNISVKVLGGGFTSQAEAVRHGIARALIAADAGYRGSLKSAGLLTRDARRKERKKPGLKRARRSPQWSKR